MANVIQDEFHKVKVTYVVDPQSFFAQLGTAESFEAFEQYEASLQAACVGKKHVTDLSEVCEGQNVLANSIETGKWHRAKVEDITSDGEVEVDFIDYGFSEYVTKDKLIDFEIEHSFQPKAVACTISHIKPITPDWIDKAIVRFEEIVLNKILDVQVEDFDGIQLVIDILVDDGKIVKTVSDILIDEKLAEAIPDDVPVDNATFEPPRQDVSVKSDCILTQKKVPEFNLMSLHKKTSQTGNKKSTKEKKDDDIEVKLLTKGLDTESKFEWAKSDLTIGSAYKPNVAHDVIGSIQDQIKQMNDARTSLSETFDKPEPRKKLSSPVFQNDDTPRVPKLQSPRVRQLQEGQHVYCNRKKQSNLHQQQDVTSSDEEKKDSRIPVARNKSYIKTTKDARDRCSDSGKLLDLLDKDIEFHSGGSRDSSPSTEGPVSNHSSIVGSSDNSPCSIPLAGILHSTYGESQDSFFHQKPFEVDASSDSISATSSHTRSASSKDGMPKPPRRGSSFDNESQFREAVGDTLKKMDHSDIASIVQIFKMLIKENLDTMPHAKRVYTCLDMILDYAIASTEQEQHMKQCIKLFDGLHDIPEVPDTISKLIWKYQNDYVRVSSMVSVKKKCLAYCKFLGRLYCCATLKWGDTQDAVQVCTKNTIDRWTCHEKWGLASMPEDLLMLYAQCLKELFSIAGGIMEKQKPSLMDKAFHDIHILVVESRIPRNVKYAYLELIRARGKRWPISAEIEIPEIVTVDASVQTELDSSKVKNYISQAEQWKKHSTVTGKKDSAGADMYHDVKSMLKSLQMIELQPTFINNCIRDTTLDLDFDDLREVLTECGLKPGHILEIKSYLRKRAIKRSRHKTDTRKGTSPSHSKKISSHDREEHTHSVETQTEKSKLSPKKEPLKESNHPAEIQPKPNTPTKKNAHVHREKSPSGDTQLERNKEKEKPVKDKAKSDCQVTPNNSPREVSPVGNRPETTNINQATIKSIVSDWISGEPVPPVVVPKLDLSEKSKTKSESTSKLNVTKKSEKGKKSSSKPHSPSSARNYSNNNISDDRPYSSARGEYTPDAEFDTEIPTFGTQRWARMERGVRTCITCGSHEHVITDCPVRRKNFFHS